MKKKKVLNIITIAVLSLSIVSMFLPFITIEKYKPVTGIELMFYVFRRFNIQKAGDAYKSLVFTSTSLPILLSFIILLVALGFFIDYYLKNKNLSLNISLAGAFAAFVLYGVQLSNSQTLVTDFFGALLTKTPVSGGKFNLQIADIDGISTGIGARMLVVFLVLTVVCLAAIKMISYINRNKEDRIQTPMSMAYRQFARHKLAILGFCIIVFMILACFYGPVFSNFALLKTNIGAAKMNPGLPYLLGTDSSGRDILTRLLYGGRISIMVGFVAVLLEIVIGTLVGGISGYYGKFADNALMRLVDIFLCLPYLPVVIILGAVMSDLKVDPQQRIFVVMLIIGFLGWPMLARLVRGQILTLREQEFMLAADALGLSDRRKIFRHLMPNVIPNVIVAATLGIGDAILSEAVLSFLGLGVAMPYPSWGNIIQAVRDPNDFALRPWIWIPAGICIFATVLAINFMGDGLRDAFDPKMKK